MKVREEEKMDEKEIVMKKKEEMEIYKERLKEKKFIKERGIEKEKWRIVDEEEKIIEEIGEMGGSGIIKIRSMGYEGKGKVRIE